MGKRSCASLGSGYGITKSCKQRDAAYEWLRSYLSTEGQIFMWASTGRGSPARWSAWDAWMTSPLAPESANVAWEMLQEYAMHDALDSPHGREISDVSGPIWDLAMLDEISVREALNQIQEACTPVMQKNAEWARQAHPGDCA
jgi:multiple sugar transport system substrate-binding protein